ncbi:hypothetical protein WJX82_000539 [Trebouxia sp. C0006]
MAIGATDAVVAASLSTSRKSIAGVAHFIREGKVVHANITSIFQYMVVYQCIVAAAETAMYITDGSHLTNLQYGVLDVQAMIMAFTAVAVAPIQHVTQHRPPARITTVPNLVMVALGATFVCLSQVLVSVLLHSCSWFHGGTGGTYENPVNSVVWLVANYSLLAPLTTFAQDIQRFAIPLPERKPQLLLAVTFMVLAYLAILCSTSAASQDTEGPLVSPKKI